jgi:NADH-quinone oxidoreductase subunit N
MVRLLAWSSVAQAGYILAPLGAYTLTVRARRAAELPESAALAYTVFYVLLELVAFAAVVALRGRADGGEIAGYRGVARRRPWAAGALALALIGLAGLPPGLAGLFAKVTVVRSLLMWNVWWLALIVALNAVLGLAYYLPVIVTLWSAPPAGSGEPAGFQPAVRVALPVTMVLTAATLVAVVIGFAPSLVYTALSR